MFHNKNNSLKAVKNKFKFPLYSTSCKLLEIKEKQSLRKETDSKTLNTCFPSQAIVLYRKKRKKNWRKGKRGGSVICRQMKKERKKDKKVKEKQMDRNTDEQMERKEGRKVRQEGKKGEREKIWYIFADIFSWRDLNHALGSQTCHKGFQGAQNQVLCSLVIWASRLNLRNMSGNHSALSDFEGRVCSVGSLHLAVQKWLYYTAQGKLLATKNISREYLKKLIQHLPQWL